MKDYLNFNIFSYKFTTFWYINSLIFQFLINFDFIIEMYNKICTKIIFFRNKSKIEKEKI